MKKFAIVLIVGLSASSVFAAEPVPAPKTAVLAGPCITCHGPEGAGTGAIPALKGRPVTALLEQLKGFKQGTAPSTVMGRLAKGYSDDQLAHLARYFGSD
ncbi:MAG: hypothetical protein EPN26_01640 [Rhodospirillales bacterium]|nr:MAG: hypothetical protein EPN26_01640 [Rhodospirillales bacterium]